MKTNTHSLIVGVTIILIVSAIYFAWHQSTKKVMPLEQAEVPTENVATSTLPQAFESNVELGTDGIVTSVDVSGAMVDGPAIIDFKTDSGSLHTIAVPTIGRSLCVANEQIADVYTISIGDRISARGMTDENGRLVPCESELHSLQVESVYANPEVGISFKYRKSPDGYQREGEDHLFSSDPSFITGVALTLTKEALALLESDVPRELPPTISLRVYANPEKLTPLAWTKANPIESNYELAMAEPVEISVATKEAVGFTADGLYATDTYVVSYDNYILVVAGQYIDTESTIYTDLEQLVSTITFTR